MNIKQLKTFLPYAAKVNVSVMIHGLHGIGKSDSVRQYCVENGLEFVDRRLSQMESGDLLGLPDLSGNTTTFKTPDWLPQDPNWKGVIFLDEINRARRDVLQGVFQLVLDRQLGGYRLPPGAQVITAVNPNTDNYDTTQVFDEALLDRFCHIKLTPSQEEFFVFMKSKSDKFNQTFVEFLQSSPDLIENSKLQDFGLEVKPSRRSNAKAAELLMLNMPKEIELEAIAGLIGLESAVAFLKYRENNEHNAFKLEEIFGDYKKIEKRVKKYSDNENGRHDLLNASFQNIETELATMERSSFTNTEKSNFLKFFLATPHDCSYNFALKILRDTSNKPAINAFRDDILLADETNEYFGITPDVLAEIEKLNAEIEAEAKKHEAALNAKTK